MKVLITLLYKLQQRRRTHKSKLTIEDKRCYDCNTTNGRKSMNQQAFQDLVDSANALLATDIAEANEVADLQAKVEAASAALATPPAPADTTAAAVAAALPTDALVAQLESLGFTVTAPAPAA